MASLAEALVQALLPSTCTLCNAGLPWRGSSAGVCPACWADVTSHQPACPVCGDPDVSDALPCLACRTNPPPWRAATSYGPYSGTLRELVLQLKRGRRDELATPLARLLLRAWHRAGWPRPDAVVPVPMWWARRLWRGFNQAALLAEALAGSLGVPCQHALRRRLPAVQTGRTRGQRRRLSAAAFSPQGRVPRRVLLVDDVLTTGTTAALCARALLGGGAAEVAVLTLARTPQPGRMP